MMQRSSSSRFSGILPVTYIWPFVRKHMRLVWAWLLALITSSGATLALPVAIGHLIDRGFSNTSNVNRTFLAVLAIALILAVATGVRFFFVSFLAEKVITDLRATLFAHFMRLDSAFYQRTHSTELQTRLFSDCEVLRSIMNATLSVALRSILTVLGSIAMMFFTSAHLALITLIAIPLALCPVLFAARMLRKIAKKYNDVSAKANAAASEALSAVSTVQAFVREEHECQRYQDALHYSLITARSRIFARSCVTASAIIVIFAAIVGVLWMGAHGVISGALSAGALGKFVLYALIGGGSVGSLAEVWNELNRAARSMERIQNSLNEKPSVHIHSPVTALPNPLRGEIVFDNVTFFYPQRTDTPALHDLSFRVEQGQTVAVVGPSGGGKSTLFQLLMRFYDPQNGSITIDGIPIFHLDPLMLRQQIAFVSQQPALFARSAAENVCYGRLDASENEMHAAAQAAQIDAFLRQLPQGYATILGEKGTGLSGGQHQRMSIARALLKNAPILLLDEATSALDTQSEHAVQQSIAHLTQGRTTLVIAHRLSTVISADRIIVIDRGQIVAQGTHSELLAAGGLYAKLASGQLLHT